MEAFAPNRHNQEVGALVEASVNLIAEPTHPVTELVVKLATGAPEAHTGGV